MWPFAVLSPVPSVQVQSVGADGSRVSDNGLWPLCPHCAHPPYPLLLTQGHQPFPHWWPSHVNAGLHRHLHLWVHSGVSTTRSPCGLSLLSHVPVAGASLLSTMCTKRQEEEGPWDPPHPLHCADCLLCTLCSWHFPMPEVPSIPNRGRGSGCLRHHPDTVLNPIIPRLRNQEVMGPWEEGLRECALCKCHFTSEVVGLNALVLQPRK